MIGGGATHTPEIARLIPYSLSGAAQGIVTPGDLKVVQLNTAGSSVRVLAGACLITSQYSGGSQQTYIGRNVSEDLVSVPATGAGSTVYRMVIARVEDPFVPGSNYQDPGPGARAEAQYVFSRLLTNVPQSA